MGLEGAAAPVHVLQRPLEDGRRRSIGSPENYCATFFLLRGSYSTVLVLTVCSFSTAVSPHSVQVVVMATLQETAVT